MHVIQRGAKAVLSIGHTVHLVTQTVQLTALLEYFVKMYVLLEYLNRALYINEWAFII